ncbi:MAG: T9SS type A sorting domain-containing protein [Saprospiraceae bacterium]
MCTRTFDPKDFLTNPDQNCTSYTLNLRYPFGTSSLNGNNVNVSHIGYTFVYEITVPGNSCWGYITVEDKAPPQPFCFTTTISCFQFADINDLAKKIIDNCTEEGKSVIEKITWTDLGCTDSRITGQVVREIRSFDKWGNSGACKDTLNIRRDSFPLIKCPDEITLSCLMKCKKTNNTGASSDEANFDTFSFSTDPKSPNYPSPDKLIDLQKRDTFNSSVRKCIPANLLVVPYIRDSVFRLVNGVRTLTDTLVSMYHSTGLLCKMLVYYNDMTFITCGNTFKIRREWRFTNWCTGRDSICVQYISVEDKTAPLVTSTFSIPYKVNNHYGNIIIPGRRIDLVSNVHDCNASFCIDSLTVEDCSKVRQNFTLTYDNPTKPGNVIVKSGLPGDCLTLSAAPNNYLFSNLMSDPNTIPDVFKDFRLPRSCYPIFFTSRDDCFNVTSSNIIYTDKYNNVTNTLPLDGIAGIYLVCISDETPPNPVCDQITQTTVDPDQCWSRIYAEDLDNGSKDNCCNLLHFAVAQMDTVDFYRKKYAKQLEDSCGKTDYWKYKNVYDQIIENWINCYVFKDYVDVTECKPLQLVLRVYEACGVPRYDEHVFKCSPHNWFCYNTYPTYMLWHNYWLKHDPSLACATPFPWLCLKENYRLIRDLIYSPDDLFIPAYPGATQLLLDNKFPLRAAYCYPEFFTESAKDVSELSIEELAPGNTCSKRLYSDCMVTILIDDKTPPVAQDPYDKFLYCDNLSSRESDQFEYASCNDNSWIPDNGKDLKCVDEFNLPYNEIESNKENDSDDSDTTDPNGKFYGWYGCNIYNIGHPDEHGIIPSCPTSDSWAPIYCRSWLILDQTDAAGKVNPSEYFDKPVLKSGNPGTSSPGENKFFIWDNCWIDTTSLTSKDESYFDKCGNGWIKRTWTAKDKCFNSVTVDQKITTKHRSDFEVLFPADTMTLCGNIGDLSPEAIGTPVIMDDECELVGINYSDQQFDIVPDACFKIVRTWRLIDWCKYDPNEQHRDQDIIVDDRKVANSIKRPCVYRHIKDNGDGYMTYVQIIVIKDTIPPSVQHTDDTVCIYDINCALPSVNIPFTATDNCTPANLITYRWEMDENPSVADLAGKKYNSGSIDKRSGANVTSLTLVQKIGVSLVTVIAKDNCGNENSTTFILTIRDCKKPTPYCYNGIATVIMPSTGSICVWASDLNAGSYDNCTSKENLKFSFGSLAAADSCKMLDCKSIPNGMAATFPVDIYVYDEAGNFDFCKTYINIQDGSGDVCDDAHSINGSISGNIQTQIAQPVEDVFVDNLSTTTLPSFKTTNAGQYAFTNIPLNTNYSIKPIRNDHPENGVSTIDLLMIQKHLLGQELLKDHYDLVAADINHDKEITTIDLIELRKLILNIYQEFPNNTSWRFVPKAFNIDAVHPFDFPEKLDISSLNSDELNKDFVGIKVGDLNHTVTAHSLQGMESRSSTPNLIFITEDTKVNADELVTIHIKADDFKGIQAFQFTLSHPDLTLISIQGEGLAIDQRNFGVFKDYITASWNQSTSKTTTAGLPLFSITFKAKKALLLSNKITINSNRTIGEAFDGKNILGTVLHWSNNNAVSATFGLDQNMPNPFYSRTTIVFNLPKDENIRINVTDLMGRIVFQKNMNGVKGSNRWDLDQNVLPGGGIYYYTLETKTYSETKKMILLK